MADRKSNKIAILAREASVVLEDDSREVQSFLDAVDDIPRDDTSESSMTLLYKLGQLERAAHYFQERYKVPCYSFLDAGPFNVFDMNDPYRFFRIMHRVFECNIRLPLDVSDKQADESAGPAREEADAEGEPPRPISQGSARFYAAKMETWLQKKYRDLELPLVPEPRQVYRVKDTPGFKLPNTFKSFFRVLAPGLAADDSEATIDVDMVFKTRRDDPEVSAPCLAETLTHFFGPDGTFDFARAVADPEVEAPTKIVSAGEEPELEDQPKIARSEEAPLERRLYKLSEVFPILNEALKNGRFFFIPRQTIRGPPPASRAA